MWLFPFTYLVHIPEEYWAGGGFLNWLSRVTGVNVAAESFLILSGIGFVAMTVATWVAIARRNHLLVLALASFTLTNTLVHVVGSVLTRSYSPGLVSGVVLWLPLAVAAIGHERHQVSARHQVGAAMSGLCLHAVVALLALTVR